MSAKKNQIAYWFIRMGIGISMFTHGLVRLPKLNTFATGMIDQFSDSMIPSALVTPMAYAIPIVEFVIGVLLVLGLFTYLSSIVGGFLMLFLLFGTGMLENWSAFPSQLIHLLFFAALILFIDNNQWAVDGLRRKT